MRDEHPTMPDLWLAQYLCPNRHAIGAVPYDRLTQAAAEIEETGRAALVAAGIELRCVLCGSRELQWEHRRLAFTNWDEALQALRACEHDQLLTRLRIRRILQDGN